MIHRRSLFCLPLTLLVPAIKSPADNKPLVRNITVEVADYIAKKINEKLSDIIPIDQSGYLKGRICNNSFLIPNYAAPTRDIIIDKVVNKILLYNKIAISPVEASISFVSDSLDTRYSIDYWRPICFTYKYTTLIRTSQSV